MAGRSGAVPSRATSPAGAAAPPSWHSRKHGCAREPTGAVVATARVPAPGGTPVSRSGRPFLQIPGPPLVPERIVRAMSQSIIDHRGPKFAALVHECLAGLKGVFQTEKGQIVIYPGSGPGAWGAGQGPCRAGLAEGGGGVRARGGPAGLPRRRGGGGGAGGPCPRRAAAPPA